MHPSVILILMVFAHIIDDYYLQGILSKMKQKKWWKENAPNPKYEYDYIAALLTHAISWSTMIVLPILLNDSFNPHWFIYVMWPVNAFIHAFTDNLKANKLKINLIQDQTIHTWQILITWALYVLI